MRKYELVCVIQPDLDEAAFNGVLDRVKGWITESGGNSAKVITCLSISQSHPPLLQLWSRTCVTLKRSCATC